MFAHSGSKSGADMEGSTFLADGKVAELGVVAEAALAAICFCVPAAFVGRAAPR